VSCSRDLRIPSTACTPGRSLQCDRTYAFIYDSEKSPREILCGFVAGDEKLGGFQPRFPLYQAEHICAALKDDRRADSNIENPTIKGRRL
jgi:hypothetical protein